MNTNDDVQHMPGKLYWYLCLPLILVVALLCIWLCLCHFLPTLFTGHICSISSAKVYLEEAGALKLDAFYAQMSTFYSIIIIVLTTLLALIQVVCYIFIKNSSTKEIESQVLTCLSGEFFKHTLNHYVSEEVIKQFQNEVRKTVIEEWLTSSNKENIDKEIDSLKERLRVLEHDSSSDDTPEGDDGNLLKETQNRMSTQEV